ncbi:MAG: hypothetical protein M3360_00080 [Actinomycetota bacterium]|nr:hypothetical protein [Actinomycetota bacterium]
MSQPRRKRRRRRKPNREQGTGARAGGEAEPSQGQQGAPGGAGRSRRRRRGAAASSAGPAKLVSSEDLVRKAHVPPPTTLTAPPDGQKLEEIIRELQSVWGVPQYPQEYRLTLKVADERDVRSARRTSNGVGDGRAQAAARAVSRKPTSETVEEGPRREKAPAAPRIGTTTSEGEDAPEATPARRKRSRRRRRGRKSP